MTTQVVDFWPDITRGTEEPAPRHKCLGATSFLKVIRCWTPSQNTLILLNKNPKIYESVLDKEVNIGQKAYDFPMVSQAAFEN